MRVQMAFVILLCSCATTGGTAQGPASPFKDLTVGIALPANADEERAAVGDLERQLSHVLDENVHVQLLPSEASLGEALSGGRVDLAWLTPFAFVEARSHGDVTPVAKIIRRGISFYRSVLFMKTESPAKTLQDLQGMKVAWNERKSASGYLIPRALIATTGLKASVLFGQETFLSDHAAVCKAVLDGTADVGATFADDRKDGGALKVDGCVRSLGEEGASHLRVVAASSPIPNDVMAARPGLPPDLVAHVGRALAELGSTPEGKMVLKASFKAEGFTEARVEEFAFVESARTME